MYHEDDFSSDDVKSCAGFADHSYFRLVDAFVTEITLARKERLLYGPAEFVLLAVLIIIA